MFFNIILPFFLADDSFKKSHKFLLRIIENHPPLDENSAIKKFYREQGEKVKNAKEYFGAIKFVENTNI